MSLILLDLLISYSDSYILLCLKILYLCNFISSYKFFWCFIHVAKSTLHLYFKFHMHIWTVLFSYDFLKYTINDLCTALTTKLTCHLSSPDMYTLLWLKADDLRQGSQKLLYPSVKMLIKNKVHIFHVFHYYPKFPLWKPFPFDSTQNDKGSR